ncbi:MAG: 4Fe-4S dicluster domain-containing protein [Sulfolobales archaeon]
MAKVLYIDHKNCISCKACEVACEREHEGINHIDVYTMEDVEISVPYTCRHCENAPCVTVCPTKALYRTDRGVFMNYLRCIGCRQCVVACPFGIPKFLDTLKVIVKCDLCRHRLMKNLPPACASTCPTGAISFVEEVEVSKAKRRIEISKIIEAAKVAKTLT